MKIVHIQQFFNDGFGYQENLLPEYQKDLGNEVILITSTRSDGFNGESRIKDEGIYIENNFLVRRIKIISEFPRRFVIFKNLYKELEDEKPDYIFHHSVTSPSIFVVAKYKKNNPNVLISMDNHADLQISGRNILWKVFYYNFFWKISLKCINKYVDVFFGVTPDRCLFLKNELGIPSEKVKLLPIGTDIKRIDLSGKSDEYNDMIPADKKIIVHGGKMSLRKNTDHLINAFNKLNTDDYHLILFGSIEDEYLTKLIEKSPGVTFLGWLNRQQTLSLLKDSYLGVWNCQHTTLIEDAIGCELPLLIKKYGSTSHLISREDIYLEEDTEKEITDKLQIVLSDKYIRELKNRTKEVKKSISYYNIAKKSIDFVVSR